MMLFDLNTVLVAIPPLVGGIVSSLIMSKDAADAGLIDLSVFAILIYVMQGFAGYPLTAVMLKREGRRVLAQYRCGQWKGALAVEGADDVEVKTITFDDEMPRLFKKIPSHYNGAKEMVRQGAVENVDNVFGMHIWSTTPSG